MNLSGLDWSQHNWHRCQDSLQNGVHETLGFPKGSLDGCPDYRMWQLVVSFLAPWAPSKEWPDVSGTSDTAEKALQEVGETLEQPNACVAMEAVG